MPSPIWSWSPPPGVPADGQASWLWLFAYFVVITVGELYLSPTGLSLVTKVAPASLLSMMMGVWLSTSFIGGFLAGYLGTFWSSMSKGNFFLMLALISAAAGCRDRLLHRPLRAVLRRLIQRQPDILLGQRSGGGLRAGEIIKIGKLAAAIESRSHAGKRCMICVIHQEKRCAYQTRRRHVAE